MCQRNMKLNAQLNMKLKEKGIEKSIIHIDFENIIDIDLYIMKTRKYHIGANTGVDPDMSTMR